MSDKCKHNNNPNACYLCWLTPVDKIVLQIDHVGGKMQRVWVVEAQLVSREWCVCDFTDKPYSDTNYFFAHKLKRELQEYLKAHGNKHWIKRRFRVKEYRAAK